jgi:hypothetical protein
MVRRPLRLPRFIRRNVDLLNSTDKYLVLCPSRGQMLSGAHGCLRGAPRKRTAMARRELSVGEILFHEDERGTPDSQ